MCIDSQNLWNIDNVNGDESNTMPIKYGDKKSKPTTYSIKKVLKALFKKNQETKKTVAVIDATSKFLSTSLESLENMRNIQVEEHYEEIEENTANEKLLSYIYDEFVGQQNISNHYHQEKQQQQQQKHHHHHHHQDEHLRIRSFEKDYNEDDENCPDDVFVPVRYARTEAGTFFWTTNLRMIDTDLVQPVYCTTTNNRQFPVMQFQLQDRWAQA